MWTCDVWFRNIFASHKIVTDNYDLCRTATLQRGRRVHRRGKSLQCSTNRHLSRKRYEIGPSLLWNVNRKSQVADRSVSVPMTSSDLERRDAKGQIFRRISLITLLPIILGRPNSDRITRAEERYNSFRLLCPTPNRYIKRCFCLTSVCLSRTSGPQPLNGPDSPLPPTTMFAAYHQMCQPSQPRAYRKGAVL